MRALVRHTYGPVDQLAVADVPVPTPAEGEVLLDVHAAGVDRGAWHLATGRPYLIRLMGYGLRRPSSPLLGLDVAGRVAAVGPGVTQFEVGQDVMGAGEGAIAESAVARVDKLVVKPAALSFVEAAAVPVSGITALQAVTEAAEVRPGQHVLVTGASGGVGSFAVQLAAAEGARVSGVASSSKADLVRDLGAERAIDYATEDYLDGSVAYDAIIDIGGRNAIRRLRTALTRQGVLVVVGGEGGGRWTGGFERSLRAAALSPLVPQKLTMVVGAEDADHLQRLLRYLVDGSVRPMVGSTYSLRDAPAALRDLEAGTVRGKAVVRVR